MVVEDNRPDAILIQEALAECGYHCEVQFATSHSQALNLLSMAHFDLMLTDFGIDYEAAERFLHAVRAVAKRMPILVLSGIVDASAAYNAGANVFVRKDGDLQVFLEKIRNVMHFWTEVAELPTQETHVPVHEDTSRLHQDQADR